MSQSLSHRHHQLPYNRELELAEQNLQGHVAEDFYKAEYTSSHSTYGFNAPTRNLNASAISYGSLTQVAR